MKKAYITNKVKTTNIKCINMEKYESCDNFCYLNVKLNPDDILCLDAGYQKYL